MTERDGNERGSKVPPETLELRARPHPVTRINRKVLIGGAAIVLLFISGIVLVALKPPSLRVISPSELFNVEHKSITDGLSKLPATYDGMKPDKKVDPSKGPSRLAPGIPKLTEPTNDPIAEAERIEKARLARMAGQAREAQVFFRLQLKALPRETVKTELLPDRIPASTAKQPDSELTALTMLQAAARARTLAGGIREGDRREARRCGIRRRAREVGTASAPALVILDIHYHPTGSVEVDDSTKLSLILADETPSMISQTLLLGNFFGRFDSEFGIADLLMQPGSRSPSSGSRPAWSGTSRR